MWLVDVGEYDRRRIWNVEVRQLYPAFRVRAGSVCLYAPTGYDGVGALGASSSVALHTANERVGTATADVVAHRRRRV